MVWISALIEMRLKGVFHLVATYIHYYILIYEHFYNTAYLNSNYAINTFQTVTDNASLLLDLNLG